MKTALFQSCGHCWVFQICWHIECSTFTASSFRIWNSSIGILSPPLGLFVVMLSKAHLTSDSSRICQSPSSEATGKLNAREQGHSYTFPLHAQSSFRAHILAWEVKWASWSITTNKASGGDGIPVELFQILKWCRESVALDMLANLENSAVATELETVNFHSNPKER